jgi:sporulation protein YlmC with PRC-barrel domain
MKRGLLALAAVATLCAALALAEPAQAPADVFLPTQGEGQYLARDLILGAQVENAEGQIVGDVEDLILNADNQIVGVVMGVGGFAGFGEKQVGVRLSALKITNEDGKVTVALPEATKAVLNGLEPFKRAHPPKPLIDRAIAKARELSDKSSVTAQDAYEQVKEQAGPALEQAREAAHNAYERAREAIETPPQTTDAAPKPEAEKPAAPESPQEPAAQP